MKTCYAIVEVKRSVKASRKKEQNNRINDSEAREIIKQVCGYSNASEIRKLDIAERNKCIKALKDGGLSIRQISRITGVSKYAVEKIQTGRQNRPPV